VKRKTVDIDLGYKPRKFQAYLHTVLRRFNVLVCHRRFGKTYFSCRHMVGKGLENPEKNPRYAYIAPMLKQAKEVAWDYIKDFTSAIPNVKVNESELRVDIPRGEPFNDVVRFKLLGAENIDALRGIYLDGVIIDEYAQIDPSLWGEIIRPTLSDRKGWAIFIGTPKGQNHFQERYIRSIKDMRELWSKSEWFATLLKASQTEIIALDELESARRDMAPEEYEQEYECSFTAALTGAYYGKLITNAENEKRVGNVPYEPQLPVQTFWDLGLDDSTVVVFAQQLGKERRIIDYLEVNGPSLPEVIKMVQQKPYTYTRHVFPWDIETRELTTGKTRLETVRPLLKNIEVGRKLPIEERIHAVKMVLPMCWFDANATEHLLNCLKNYSRKFDKKKNIFSDKPDHNWASHGADAFGYFALEIRPDNDFQRDDLPRTTDVDYDYWY